MRSRYSAFACALGAYLLDTWHPSTRPARLDLDPGLEWRRLQIRDRSAGGEQDPDGTVSFVAHFYDTRRREYGRLVETSRFIREDGRWLYLEAVA